MASPGCFSHITQTLIIMIKLRRVEDHSLIRSSKDNRKGLVLCKVVVVEIVENIIGNQEGVKMMIEGSQRAV
jgi:hypothetical protein